MSASFDDLAPLSYDVIVADPPWRFRTWGEHNQTKSASRHYALMTTETIKALPVGRLAQRDCLLLLWATECMRPQAHEVMSAWGFTYKSALVWRKVTKNGKPRMGTGYWARTMHEPVLIGCIGKPRKFSAFPSCFDGVAREHSRKPDEFYTLVERHTASLRRLDLFSRESRPGFDGWGHEVAKFDPPSFAGPIRPMVGSLDAAAPPTLPQAAGLDANFWTSLAEASPGPSPHPQGSLDPATPPPHRRATEPCR